MLPWRHLFICPNTGTSVRHSLDCHALLHLRHHWNAGEVDEKEEVFVRDHNHNRDVQFSFLRYLETFN